MLKLVVAGDVCMRGQEDSMDAERARSILAPVQPILDAAHIRIANWENPTTASAAEGAPIAKSGAMLHSRPENIAFLQEGHFDVAILANNHTGDYGPTGAMATKRYLEAAGLLTVGAGADLEQAREPLFLTREGGTIAIFATCEHEFGIAGRESPGAAGFDARALRSAIAQAKKRADWVIVIHHGGNEHNPLPSPHNRARYQDVIDMGADALIGMHPHCPQGWEIYQGKPIVYSTGNFMFRAGNSTLPPDNAWHYGYLVGLTFQKGCPPTLEISPYQFDPEVRQIQRMEGAEKAKMLEYLQTISRCFLDPVEHERLFLGWCMIAAPGYALATRFDARMPEMPDDPATLSLRNVFSCEAHNELLTTYMRMIVERRLDVGQAYAPIVRGYQNMPVNLWP